MKDSLSSFSERIEYLRADYFHGFMAAVQWKQFAFFTKTEEQHSDFIFNGNLHQSLSGQISTLTPYTTLLTHLEQRNEYLFTLGKDDEHMLKIFQNDFCLKVYRLNAVPCGLFVGKETVAVLVKQDLWKVIIVRFDLERKKFSKIKTVFESEFKVTGICFINDHFYISTTEAIHAFKPKEKPILVDQQGAQCITKHNQDLIVGRKEACYFYSLEGRGPCFIISGDKIQLEYLNEYLVVVEEKRVTLYHLKLKFIAFDEVFECVRKVAVSEADGVVYIFLADKTVVIKEKDIDARIEILFSRNLYALALKLKESPQVMTKYADFLYLKGEFTPAMDIYIQTIGKLDSSHVIRKVNSFNQSILILI